MPSNSCLCVKCFCAALVRGPSAGGVRSRRACFRMSNKLSTTEARRRGDTVAQAGSRCVAQSAIICDASHTDTAIKPFDNTNIASMYLIWMN